MAAQPVWNLVIEDGYDAAGAVSASASLAQQRVRYDTLDITLRRRAPHAITARIPFAPNGGSTGLRLNRFDAWRELRISRDGISFLGGLQGAAAVPGGERGGMIELTGYGNAMALIQFWGDQPGDNATIDQTFEWLILESAGNATRADNVIALMLQYAIRGTTYPGTRWFPSAGYTLATGTYVPERLSLAGMSQLEIIQMVCDAEGWEWRAGVDSSGNWTFAAGGSVNVDRTATVLLDSPGNCLITDYQPDATRLATRVSVAIRNQGPETTVFTTTASGNTAMPIGFGTADRYFPGAWLRIDPDGANLEDLEVDHMNGEGEIVFKNATSISHTAGERIIYSPDIAYVREVATTGKTSEDRHHRIRRVIYNDQLRDEDARTTLAETVMDASDDLLHGVTVRVTDVRRAEQWLGLGLHPGDTVSLTSARLPFDATAMQVQEMTLHIEKSSLRWMDLLLGDPAEDGLAVLERRIAASRLNATRTA